MKKLIISLMIIYPIIAKGQSDSIKVSFSEEKVENFEKTTLMDEYEKAFGENRVVKGALRIAFNLASTSFLPASSSFASKSLVTGLTPTLLFEQKIDVDKSLIVGFAKNRGQKDLVWNSDVSLEGRWYYQMKKRVEQHKQQPNITGKYVSLRAEANPYGYNPDIVRASTPDATKLQTYMFRATSTYSFNWGWQFGNNLNYGFSIGIKHGNKAGIGAENYWINEAQSSRTGITPYISTTSQLAFGIYLPFRRKLSDNYCDFLRCNYEVKQLFKVNTNNAFYLDRYTQYVKLDFAYERKIGRSPFSLNSNLIGGFTNYAIFRPTGARIDTTFNEAHLITSLISRPTYSPEIQNYSSYNFEIAEQIRYYIGMQRRIARGKSASNLSGIYLGIVCAYKVRIERDYSAGMDVVSFYNTKINQLNIGLVVGSQIQTNRNSFADLSLSLLSQKYLSSTESLNIPKLTNPLLDFSLKLGFAR